MEGVVGSSVEGTTFKVGETCCEIFTSDVVSLIRASVGFFPLVFSAAIDSQADRV